MRHPVAALMLFALSLPSAPSFAADAAASTPIVGTYPDDRLAAFANFTLPRTFLYDSEGELIPQEQWPAGLSGLKRHAGDAFCCVSDTPVPPGSSGPPADCEVRVYGTDVEENFEGLVDRSGRSIAPRSLPPHEYLLVEYYATWCLPCEAGRRAIESFLRTSAEASDYVWLTIDVSRLPEAQEAARQPRREGR